MMAKSKISPTTETKGTTLTLRLDPETNELLEKTRQSIHDDLNSGPNAWNQYPMGTKSAAIKYMIEHYWNLHNEVHNQFEINKNLQEQIDQIHAQKNDLIADMKALIEKLGQASFRF